MSRNHKTDEAGFFSLTRLAESLSLAFFVCFSECCSHCLGLLSDNLIQTSTLDSQASFSLSLSQWSSLLLSHGTVFLPLSLTSSKSTHYWCFSLHHGPRDAFLFLVLPPFICQRFSVVFSPQVCALSCTQMCGYNRGLAEFLKAKTSTDSCSQNCWWTICQYRISVKTEMFLLNHLTPNMSLSVKDSVW